MSEVRPGSVSHDEQPASPAFGAGLVAVGTELLTELQEIIGHTKVKALRVNLGRRHIKDIPINGATALATIGLALLAIIISNLRVEVVKE